MSGIFKKLLAIGEWSMFLWDVASQDFKSHHVQLQNQRVSAGYMGWMRQSADGKHQAIHFGMRQNALSQLERRVQG